MGIQVPPRVPRGLMRVCGSIPYGTYVAPSIAQESRLPDDLILSAQGVRSEASNPLPLSQEGSLDLTQDNQFRVIIRRRSTPNGTLEERVISVDTGNHVHATLTPTNLPVISNPVSESAVETVPDNTSLPAPETVTEGSVSSGPTVTEVLQAEFAAREAASSGSAPAPAPTTTAPVSYSTSSASYAAAAPAQGSTSSTLNYTSDPELASNPATLSSSWVDPNYDPWYEVELEGAYIYTAGPRI